MPKLAPRATKPADFPAQILAAAEKNATVRALIERFDRSVAFAQIEITHAEARALIQDLFGQHKAEKLPSEPTGFGHHEFKIPQSGGWAIALGYRRARVFGNLEAPEDFDLRFSRPVVLTRDEFIERHSPKGVAGDD